MDIEYKGGNCVVISSKKAVLSIDPKLSSIGLKDIAPKDAVVIATQPDFTVESDVLVIDQPGEYEIRDISVKGVPAQRMLDAEGELSATMYRVVIDGVRIAVLGHVFAPLSDATLEMLGVIDVVIIPVGGNGYTMDGHQAVGVVRQIDPRVVIPTHYADASAKYEVPQEDLEPFTKELSAPQHEVLAKWKVKNGVLPETLTLIELQRTS